MKSKRYKKAESFLKESKVFSFKDALKVLKNYDSGNLNQIRVSFSLNRKSKSQFSFREFSKIPHVVKNIKIAVIESDFSLSLKDKLGDSLFISIEDLEKIVSKRNKKNWGFDKLFADVSVLDKIKKFARKLSAKKCFPNLKDGTILKSENEIKDYLDGRIEVRSDKDGNFNFLIGKTDFEDFKIEDNYNAIFDKVKSLKPVNWKGDYLKNIVLSTTMGPGVKVLFK